MFGPMPGPPVKPNPDPGGGGGGGGHGPCQLGGLGGGDADEPYGCPY